MICPGVRRPTLGGNPSPVSAAAGRHHGDHSRGRPAGQPVNRDRPTEINPQRPTRRAGEAASPGRGCPGGCQDQATDRGEIPHFPAGAVAPPPRTRPAALNRQTAPIRSQQVPVGHQRDSTGWTRRTDLSEMVGKNCDLCSCGERKFEMA